MGNTIRFTGLSSGLDTQSIVEALMTNYQNKVDTQKQNKQLLEWKKEAYKEINTKINTFYDKYIDNLSIASKMNQNKTSVSNTNVISINEGQNVQQGNYEIEVKKVATGSVVSTNKIDKVNLEDAWISASGNQEKRFKISIGEEVIDVDLSNKMKVSELVDEVQKQLKDKNISATFKFENGKFITKMIDSNDNTPIKMDIENSGVLKEVTIKDLSLEDIYRSMGKESISENFTMSIGGKKIELKNASKMTIEEFETNINVALKDNGLEVNFKFDTKLQAFQVSSKNTGASSQIEIEEGADLINAVGGGKTATGSIAQDAEVIYNGVLIQQSSNTIETDGMSFNIVGEGKSTVTSQTDTEAVVSYVKEFVDAYNTLLDELNTKYGADKNNSYKPLTEAQKEEMSEKEIELWESKIKGSLFSGDSAIGDLVATLRDTVEGKISEEKTFNILAEIGVTTSNWKEKGKLHLDEAKLTEALNKNAEGVRDLVKTLGDNLKTNLKSTLKSSNDLKSYNSIFNDKLILEEISAREKAITLAQERYDRMENYYYAKFTAMETMMNQYSSQSAWLSQQ